MAVHEKKCRRVSGWECGWAGGWVGCWTVECVRGGWSRRENLQVGCVVGRVRACMCVWKDQREFDVIEGWEVGLDLSKRSG